MEWDSSSEDMGIISSCLGLRPGELACSPLTSAVIPERVGVTFLRAFSVIKPGALGVVQPKNSPARESNNVDSRHSRWIGGFSKAGDTDVPIGVDEDVLLDERERMSRL